MINFIRKTYLYFIIIPLLLIIVGAGLNQLVLIANHDTFPVLVNYANGGMLDGVHIVMSNQTHLNFFGDIFDLGNRTVSVGDLFIELGFWLWYFCKWIWAWEMLKFCKDIKC